MAGGETKQHPDNEEAGWQYKPAGGDIPTTVDFPTALTSTQKADEHVEWTASEFIAHEKSFGWYALFVLFTLTAAALVYLVTRDIVSAVGVSMMALILLAVAGRKPRTLTYQLDSRGLKVGERFHSYGEYKSFALINEGPFFSLVLLPLKRFGLPLSLYLAPDEQEAVIKIMGNHLPLERGELGLIEQLMRKARF